MNKFEKCEKCHEWHWNESECKPIYLVYHEGYLGEESKSVRASNHDDAALEYAQWYNTGNDYLLMNDTIEIRVEKDGVIKYFRVGAEPDINYSSTEISSPLDF